MKVKASHIVVGGVLLALVLYLGVRTLAGGGDKAKAEPPKKADAAQLVRVALVPETQRPYAVVLRGRTEASRTVSVRAETPGQVAATPIPEGSFVRRGQVLCRLDVDARGAQLAQAQANQRSEELQYQAAQELKKRGFRSETQVLAAKA